MSNNNQPDNKKKKKKSIHIDDKELERIQAAQRILEKRIWAANAVYRKHPNTETKQAVIDAAKAMLRLYGGGKNKGDITIRLEEY
jgi:hypothetical protein